MNPRANNPRPDPQRGARVELRGISKTYPNGVRALVDVELVVEPGEILVLLGPSGSGKSTLARVVAGLETPDAGRILIDGRDATTWPPHRRGLAFLFQEAALMPHLDVARNLEFGLRTDELDPKRRDAVLARLGLESVARRRPSSLSGGQRQRAALGAAILRDPPLALLDEPLANLDPPRRADLRRALRAWNREAGVTLLHVTHDQHEARALAHRVALLDAGRLVETAPPRQLWERPASLFARAFLGEPPWNVLPLEKLPRSLQPPRNPPESAAWIAFPPGVVRTFDPESDSPPSESDWRLPVEPPVDVEDLGDRVAVRHPLADAPLEVVRVVPGHPEAVPNRPTTLIVPRDALRFHGPDAAPLPDVG